MSFFSKDDGGAGGALEPVSNERLARLFDENEVSYGRGPEGDLGGYWDDHLFVFWHGGKSGELFQVRGRWMRAVPESELARILSITNDWHRDKLWPKAYAEVHDGEVLVFGEHTVDYEAGATDEQVNLHVGTGISATLELFETLDEQFGEHTAADKARLAADGT